MRNHPCIFLGTLLFCIAPGVYAQDSLQRAKIHNAAWLGLVVVDGSTAMEGNGPTEGTLVPMGLIVAGTNPLATDMVAARTMGFTTEEIPTFRFARRTGMSPASLEDVEVRGEKIADVTKKFKKPDVFAWENTKDYGGVKEME